MVAVKKRPEEVIRSRVLHLRLPAPMLDALDELSVEEGVTVLEYIRSVLRDHVRGVEWERGRVSAAKSAK